MSEQVVTGIVIALFLLMAGGIPLMLFLEIDYRDRSRVAFMYVLEKEQQYFDDIDIYRLTMEDARLALSEIFARLAWYDVDKAYEPNFWRDEYKALLELFLAVGKDVDSKAELAYGTMKFHGLPLHLDAPPPIKMLWIEYTYKDKDWVLWLDPDTENHSTMTLRNSSYRKFYSYGKVKLYEQHDYYDVHSVCEYYLTDY